MAGKKHCETSKGVQSLAITKKNPICIGTPTAHDTFQSQETFLLNKSIKDKIN